ncbi:Predicted arabinose efflux permease, MFS family [Ferrimonas sediminum]|uniref:Predicted arabinose efflux permease, MFS family n=1 Tax=Ferrimonas sediminum TaxID=718193 RepID=A0A1G9AST3_9GAMM|nr:MFS transporter [Ferrimonas sediminum]SDK29914.1 Predicted arabinose efflux permease, MFS family [Ferrimonas sediminum]
MDSRPYYTFGVTLLITLISVCGIALPYPILAPLFLDLQHPISQFAGIPEKLLLGAVLAIYPVGILIGSNYLGAWSDRLGRKRVLSWTMLGATLSYGLTAFAIEQGSFLLFTASRLLTGLFEGNLAIARAIAADLHPKIDRTRAFSYLSAMGYAGYLIGPVVGGFLLPLGASLAFWVAAAACAAATGLILLALPKDTGGRYRQQGSSLSLLKHPHYRDFFVCYLMLMLALNGFYEFYPVWLVEYRQFNSEQIAWATVLLTSAMIATAVMATMKVKRWLGLVSAGVVGVLLFAVAIGSFPYGNGDYLASFIAAGIGIALFNAMMPSYLSEHAQDSQGQGQLMGLLTTVFCLGNVIIAIVGAALALVDTRLVLMTSALLAVIASGLFWRLARSAPRGAETIHSNS